MSCDSVRAIDDVTPGPLVEVARNIACALSAPERVLTLTSAHDIPPVVVQKLMLRLLAPEAGIDRLVVLRGESPVAWQSSIVSTLRRESYPEAFARDVDHPRQGLIRLLQEARSPLVQVDACADAESLGMLHAAVPQARFLLTNAPETIAPADTPRYRSIAWPETSGDVARSILAWACGGSLNWLTDALKLWRALPPDLGSLHLLTAVVHATGALSAPFVAAMASAVRDESLTPLGVVTRACRIALMHGPFWDRLVTGDRSLILSMSDNRKNPPGDDLYQLVTPAAWRALRREATTSERLAGLEEWRDELQGLGAAPGPADRLAPVADAVCRGWLEVSQSGRRPGRAAFRVTRSLCRAVGASTAAIEWARAAVAEPVGTDEQAPDTADARDLQTLTVAYAEAARWGESRKSGKRLEELLEAFPEKDLAALVFIKCHIAEIDLQECRVETAFRRLEDVRGLLEHQAIAPDLEARWRYLRGACCLAGHRPEAAARLLTSVLATLTGRHPADHPELLKARALLARALFGDKQFLEARGVLERELEIRRRSPFVTPLETATAALLLADLHVAQGQLADAEALLAEVLHLRRLALGEGDRLVGESAGRLAALISGRGDYAAAEPLFKQALSIAETHFGDQHPKVAAVLCDLAEMLFAQRRFDQTRRILERALTIQSQSLRRTDPRIARTRASLAAVHVARGHYDAAQRLYLEELAAAGDCGDQPALATTLNNLGDVCRTLGQAVEAEEYLRRGLQMRERLYGPAHPTVAQSLTNLGYLHLTRGRLGVALHEVERGLRIRRECLSDRHPHVANSLMIRGRIAWRQGRLEDARKDLELAAGIAREAFGDRHQQSGALLAALGRIELACGQRAMGELHLLKARAILDETVGGSHRLSAEVLHGLAEVAAGERRLLDAFPFLERSLAILRQTTDGGRYELAEVLLALGRNVVERGVVGYGSDRLREAIHTFLELEEPPAMELAEAWSLLARAELAVANFREAKAAAAESLRWAEERGDDDSLGAALELQAQACLGLEETAAAEVLLRRWLAVEESRAVPAEDRLLAVWKQLSAVLILQGRSGESERFLRESLARLEQRYGRRHTETAQEMLTLATVLASQGRSNEAAELEAAARDVLATTLPQRHQDCKDHADSAARPVLRGTVHHEAQPLPSPGEPEDWSGHVLDDLLVGD